MKRPARFSLGCALAAATLLSAPSFAAAPAAPPDQPPADAPEAQTSVTLAGRVESFNLNEQRGSPDGIILVSNGQRTQVNLPESIVDAVTKAVAVGDTIQATVLPEGGPGGGRGGPGRGGRGNGTASQPNDGRGGQPEEQAADHPVVRAQSVRDAHGQLYAATDQGPGGPGGGNSATVNGAIKAFNYDHRGTVNGLQLGTGDLVRLPGNAASQSSVKLGDQVSVEGNSRPMASGRGNIIEAKTLNGTELHGGRGGPGGPADGPPPPPDGGPDGGPDGAGGPPPPPGGGPGGRGGRGPAPGAADPTADLPPQEADPGPPPPGPDEGPDMAPPPGPNAGPDEGPPAAGPAEGPPAEGPMEGPPAGPVEGPGPMDGPAGPDDGGNGPGDPDQF